MTRQDETRNDLTDQRQNCTKLTISLLPHISRTLNLSSSSRLDPTPVADTLLTRSWTAAVDIRGRQERPEVGFGATGRWTAPNVNKNCRFWLRGRVGWRV